MSSSRISHGFRLSHIDLIALKVAGGESEPLHADLAWHEAEVNRLCAQLDVAREASSLPDEPNCQKEMDDLLVRIRMMHLHRSRAHSNRGQRFNLG